jgi:hypothetical protein
MMLFSPIIEAAKKLAKMIFGSRVAASFLPTLNALEYAGAATKADNTILCLTSYRLMCSGFGKFSDTKSAKGAERKGDSGKRNEESRPIPIWKFTLVNVILILTFVCQIILLFLELTMKAK